MSGMIGAQGKAKAQVQRALDRGQAQGLGRCAVYLAGEDVRCPGLATEATPCGGFLFVRGLSGPVLVRAYEERRTGDRRAMLRDSDRRHADTYRCPKQDHHRIEIESHQSMTGAA